MGKNYYKGVVFSVELIYRLFSESVDELITAPWRSNFFYQLHSMLYLIGNHSAEYGTTLTQIMEILCTLHARGSLSMDWSVDHTLEFKIPLTQEKLILNRYPELRDAYQEIAMGILATGKRVNWLDTSE